MVPSHFSIQSSTTKLDKRMRPSLSLRSIVEVSSIDCSHSSHIINLVGLRYNRNSKGLPNFIHPLILPVQMNYLSLVVVAMLLKRATNFLAIIVRWCGCSTLTLQLFTYHIIVCNVCLHYFYLFRYMNYSFNIMVDTYQNFKLLVVWFQVALIVYWYFVDVLPEELKRMKSSFQFPISILVTASCLLIS